MNVANVFTVDDFHLVITTGPCKLFFLFKF